MDREAWRAAIHGVTKIRTWLSDWTELNWKMSCCLRHPQGIWARKTVGEEILSRCWKTPPGKGTWRATVHGAAKIHVVEWLITCDPAHALYWWMFSCSWEDCTFFTCIFCYIKENLNIQSDQVDWWYYPNLLYPCCSYSEFVLSVTERGMLKSLTLFMDLFVIYLSDFASFILKLCSYVTIYYGLWCLLDEWTILSLWMTLFPIRSLRSLC